MVFQKRYSILPCFGSLQVGFSVENVPILPTPSQACVFQAGVGLAGWAGLIMVSIRGISVRLSMSRADSRCSPRLDHSRSITKAIDRHELSYHHRPDLGASSSLPIRMDNNLNTGVLLFWTFTAQPTISASSTPTRSVFPYINQQLLLFLILMIKSAAISSTEAFSNRSRSRLPL